MRDTEVLRRFNRTYTQRIGVLDDSFLGLGVPLAAARMVFEVGAAGAAGASVRDLRARLGLDYGHATRLLQRLEGDGLVALGEDPADRRVRRVSLTAAGTAFQDRLEAVSEEKAATLLEPLTARQRERLAEALATADLLVRAATVELAVVDPGTPAAQAAMTAYFDELDARFPDGFDPGPPAYDDLGAAQGGAFLLATSDGEPVACGGVRDLGDLDGARVAEIKRMWVHDAWRGAGLGSRLLRELEALALASGYALVRLDTKGVLGEAVAMYGRAGYAEIERYNDNPYAEHFFEKPLTARA
jgi:DNA-binding MarR family transcriptional regulator/GNAT superfamily N-acetyltransferase